MSRKMLKFVKIGQQNPPKREISNRKEDFNEIYKDFIQEKTKEPEENRMPKEIPPPIFSPFAMKMTGRTRISERRSLTGSKHCFAGRRWRIRRSHGTMKMAPLMREDMRNWYKEWGENGSNTSEGKE